MKKKPSALNAEFDAARALEREHLSLFIERCFRTLSPGRKFEQNWHIAALAWHLEQVRLGKIKRLIINMPPRSLKSISASVAFPAFVLGKDPTKRIVCLSYGTDLATKHANDFRAVVRSRIYRKTFPEMVISSVKDTEGEVATTRGGSRLSTSVGATVTGRGGDIIIIDDPLKPIDALSDAAREKVNEWFFHTLLSRLDDHTTGAIVIVMQRLHLYDLTGAVLSATNGWTVLTLPAIAEEDQDIRIGDNKMYSRKTGDVLQPRKMPIEILETFKKQLGTYNYAAQFQQRPIPLEGGTIKPQWVRRYTTLPEQKGSARMMLSLDTASKDGSKNDWSVCTAWLIAENKYYLVDVMRIRADYPTLKARMIAFAAVHKPRKILIEDSGVGTALIAELKKACHCAIVAVKPERDKRTRMAIEAAKFEAGQVYLPERAPWLADLEAELFAFPQSKFDDQVDSISQALSQGVKSYDHRAHANFLARLCGELG